MADYYLKMTTGTFPEGDAWYSFTAFIATSQWLDGDVGVWCMSLIDEQSAEIRLSCWKATEMMNKCVQDKPLILHTQHTFELEN